MLKIEKNLIGGQINENPQKGTIDRSDNQAEIKNILAKDNMSFAKKQINTSFFTADIQKNPDFKKVFPNFSVVVPEEQQAIIKKIELFQKKYPDFISRLASIDNPQYGPGFQYYFVPDKSHPEYKSVPKVLDQAMSGRFAGIVFGGTEDVLSDTPLKKPVAFISQKVVNSGLVSEKIALDLGGMYTTASANTFAHEMGHVIHSYFLTNQERLELWSIYGKARENGKFITDYAKTNHMEFFAEGVEAYFHQDSSGKFDQREKLKKENIDLYLFVQKVLEPGVKGKDKAISASLADISGYVAKSSYQKGKEKLTEWYQTARGIF